MSTSDDTLFGIYLNDHLAGSTGGVDLIRRIAKAERNWVGAAALQRLAEEIEQDRKTLLELMKTLDVPVSLVKTWIGWAGEKVGRLKFNGALLRRSPLSRVLELEAMMLGVEGKAAAWRTLRERAQVDSRIDEARVDGLISRAKRQSDELEQLRVRAVAEALGGKVEPLADVPDATPPFERKPR
jgi:hypothetical protein